MYCSACKTQNRPTARFCRMCGRQVSAQPAVTEAPAISLSSTPAVASPAATLPVTPPVRQNAASLGAFNPAINLQSAGENSAHVAGAAINSAVSTPPQAPASVRDDSISLPFFIEPHPGVGTYPRLDQGQLHVSMGASSDTPSPAAPAQAAPSAPPEPTLRVSPEPVAPRVETSTSPVFADVQENTASRTTTTTTTVSTTYTKTVSATRVGAQATELPEIPIDEWHETDIVTAIVEPVIDDVSVTLEPDVSSQRKPFPNSRLLVDKQLAHCPQCNLSFRKADRYCTECGGMLTRPQQAATAQPDAPVSSCGRCQATVSTNHKFCPCCGNSVAEEDPMIAVAEVVDSVIS